MKLKPISEMTYMSGAETLIPFIKERKKDEETTIIVDSREANSAAKIVKGLL